MKKIKHILIIFFILQGYSFTNSFSQEISAGIDTLKQKGQQEISAGEKQQTVQAQVREQERSRVNQQAGGGPEQAGADQNRNANQAKKQINSARPDMSKASGARPPQIVRPSGSAMPKGMGKPGGVMRRGGR